MAVYLTEHECDGMPKVVMGYPKAVIIHVEDDACDLWLLNSGDHFCGFIKYCPWCGERLETKQEQSEHGEPASDVLKLYLWRTPFGNHADIWLFALAHNLAEAKELSQQLTEAGGEALIIPAPPWPDSPLVVETPRAFSIYEGD